MQNLAFGNLSKCQMFVFINLFFFLASSNRQIFPSTPLIKIVFSFLSIRWDGPVSWGVDGFSGLSSAGHAQQQQPPPADEFMNYKCQTRFPFFKPGFSAKLRHFPQKLNFTYDFLFFFFVLFFLCFFSRKVFY